MLILDTRRGMWLSGLANQISNFLQYLTVGGVANRSLSKLVRLPDVHSSIIDPYASPRSFSLSRDALAGISDVYPHRPRFVQDFSFSSAWSQVSLLQIVIQSG